MEAGDLAGIGRVHHRLRDLIYPELMQADMPSFLGRESSALTRPPLSRKMPRQPLRRYVAVPGLMVAVRSLNFFRLRPASSRIAVLCIFNSYVADVNLALN